MGKAQSKRSVDITTETKKGTEDEITEKMEKIEDLDKKEVNGDAIISEKDDPEKKVDQVENDKDMATEKEVDVQASGESTTPQNTIETSKEEEGSVTAEEEISPLADESIKKSKKEKVKKKWSFRSISFGKKDKQKPAKSEEVVEDGGAAVNDADNNEKTNESEDTQKDKSASENEEKTTDTHENGNATPQELNEKQNGEKLSDDKTANTTNNITTTKTCEPVQNEIAAVSSELSEKTENTDVVNETKTSEATVGDVSNNGNGIDEKINVSEPEPLKSVDTNASAKASSEKISLLVNAGINESSATTNGEVADQIHQNGDHGEAENEKSKAKIEVNSNTDNNVSAATLDSLSSTSISPNVQTHVQDLKVSSEVPDEIVQINNDEPVIESFTDTDINIQTIDQSVNNVIAGTLEVIENNAQTKDVFDASSSKMVVEISLLDKLVVDSQPPPLPISPPPSQVAVFAFINNEDTIQTKNFESAINNLIEEKKTERPLPPSNLPLKEIYNNQEIGSNTLPIESEAFDDKIISKEPDAQLQGNEVNITVVESECEENNLEKEEANCCKHNKTDKMMTPSVICEKTQNNEEASMAYAATVTEEITERAVEIVKNQHLGSGKEQITNELLSSSQNYLKIFQDEVNEKAMENYLEDTTHSKNVYDGQDLMCDDGQKLEELPLFSKRIDNKTIEYSLDFTETDLIHQNEEEMNSLNKSINLDDIHLDVTKEFATAKDIKDNVTVAEVTQELSVTCE